MVSDKQLEAGTLIFTAQWDSDDVWSVTCCSSAEWVLLGSSCMQIM